MRRLSPIVLLSSLLILSACSSSSDNPVDEGLPVGSACDADSQCAGPGLPLCVTDGLYPLEGLAESESEAARALAGIGVCKFLAKYPVVTLPQDIFYQLTLPVRMEPLDVVSVTMAALLLSLLATLYPAWKAARVPPAETLRYE